MSNKVKDEVIYIRIYDSEPTSTPTVADVVASPGFELSMEGNGLQEFNLPKTAETRDTTGRHGFMKSETRGVIDYEGDFMVDWVALTAPLLDSETKYLAFVRRELGTGSGRTQQLGGGPIMQCNIIDRDGGFAFDVTFDGDIDLARSSQ